MEQNKKRKIARLKSGCTYQIVDKKTNERLLAQVDRNGNLLGQSNLNAKGLKIFAEKLKRENYEVRLKLGS